MFVTVCRSVMLACGIVVLVAFQASAQDSEAAEGEPSSASASSERPQFTRLGLPPLRLRWLAPISEVVSASMRELVMGDPRWFEGNEGDEDEDRGEALWAHRLVLPTDLPCASEPGGSTDCRAVVTVAWVELP